MKRWEAGRGLPVHRAPGGARSKVYAYARELTAWLEGADAILEEPDAPSPPPTIEDAPEKTPTAKRPAWRRARTVVLAATAVIVLSALAVGANFARLASFGGAQAARGADGGRAAPDAEAVDLYRSGLHDWNTRTPQGLHMAVDEFTQAIVRDPNYAEAYVGLANCYNLLREYTNMAPSEAYPRAKSAALRAIALDDSLAGAHLALAFEEFYWEWNTPAAEREFQRALALDPGSATAHHWYANFLLTRHRFDDALVEIDRAQALDPVSTAVLSDRALILNAAGKSETAVSILQGIEHTDPNYLSPHTYLADIDYEAGQFESYLRELDTIGVLLHDSTQTLVAAAAMQGWKAGGRNGMLSSMLREQLALNAQDRVSAYDVARTYARLGDTAKALAFLAASKSRHESQFLDAGTDRVLDGLRGLPVFERIARLSA